MPPVAQMMLVEGDLDEAFYREVLTAREVAWDIETSGLDWTNDRIGTCQLATDRGIAVVQLGSERAPARLASLLESRQVTKVFHHAPFDLRFMVAKWGVAPASIACTKVASKILEPDLPHREHSLQPVLARTLGRHISKDQQRSDWLSSDLTEEQIEYAVADVAYLLPLARRLRSRCEDAGVGALLSQAWNFLPVRAQLDLMGVGDVFAY